MENSIKSFKNKVFGEIRTMTNEQGETFFVGKDVAKALGYSKPLNAVSMHVDEDDSLKWGLIDTKGRVQQTILINESGLYSLILSSQLQSARTFKRWVTSEVLPAIRETGRYEAKAQMHLLESKCGLLEAMCEELRSRAEYAQAVLCSEDTMTVTQIAQDYGVGAVSLNQLLRHMRIQRRTGGQWVLYGQYQGPCYVRSFAVYRVDQNDGHVSINPLTRWTQLGRHFIYEQLKTRLGILPNTPGARPRILAILKEAREKGGAA